MNYGLPYKGSKNRIAKKILEVLPPAPVLYDVFAGGCAITHAALLSGKYSRVVANDINSMIPHAFETAITGGFSNEDRWISREDFQRLYKTDPYVAICFSFGNDLRWYCYARELEPYKRALHYAIFWKDTAPWRELCPETADALKKAVESEQDRHKRRIGAGRAIVTALKAGLVNGTIDPAVMNKSIYRKIRKEKTPGLSQSAESVERLKSLETLENDKRLQRLERLESLERFERLKNLKTLQTDESLCRLQSLESLERITDVDVPPVLTVTTEDYKALTFERGGIIYCDPPYKSTEERYGREFDFNSFYSWCEHQANPVFISEYTMPEDRFVPVAAFTVTRKMDARKSNICPEKIWRPRCQLGI
jgi:site-specific DNA-adenine methylase